MDDPGPAERGSELDCPVVERRRPGSRPRRPRPAVAGAGLVLAGLLVHLRGQPGQVRQFQPGRRGAEQDLIRRRPRILRQAAGPPADLPRVGRRDRLGGQRGVDRRDARRPRLTQPVWSAAVPRVIWVRCRSHENGPVIPVIGVILPGPERPQHRGPRRRSPPRRPSPGPAGTPPAPPPSSALASAVATNRSPARATSSASAALAKAISSAHSGGHLRSGARGYWPGLVLAAVSLSRAGF